MLLNGGWSKIGGGEFVSKPEGSDAILPVSSPDIWLEAGGYAVAYLELLNLNPGEPNPFILLEPTPALLLAFFWCSSLISFADCNDSKKLPFKVAVFAAWQMKLRTWCFPSENSLPNLCNDCQYVASSGVQKTNRGHPHNSRMSLGCGDGIAKHDLGQPPQGLQHLLINL
jgi:hypothetical protein